MSQTPYAGSGDVVLELPMTEDSLLIARMAVSGALARTPFDVDVVEDIKTAVAEACYLLMHQPVAQRRLRVVIAREEAFHARVAGIGEELTHSEETAPDVDVCRLVLSSMMPDVQIDFDGQRILSIAMSCPME